MITTTVVAVMAKDHTRALMGKSMWSSSRLTTSWSSDFWDAHVSCGQTGTKKAVTEENICEIDLFAKIINLYIFYGNANNMNFVECDSIRVRII